MLNLDGKDKWDCSKTIFKHFRLNSKEDNRKTLDSIDPSDYELETAVAFAMAANASLGKGDMSRDAYCKKLRKHMGYDKPVHPSMEAVLEIPSYNIKLVSDLTNENRCR